ncbi:MAG: ATP-binding protein [Burkholderiaceae bacterium]|nr:HAMP domain-containing protein [Burkholderiales bacterium]MCZ8341367.1 ATP-binding protein [Burkholderiaceae bacterium]
MGFAAAFISVATVYAGLQLVLAQRFGSVVTRMSMEGQSEDFFDGLQFGAAGEVVGVALPRGEAFGYDAFYANLKYRVLDARGRVVASSEPGGGSLLPHLSVEQQRDFFGVVRLDGVDFYIGAWQREVNGRPYVVQLGRSDRFEELAREAIGGAIAETVGLLAGLSVIVFSLAGVLAVRSVLRPIADTLDAASRVGRDNLQARLPEAGMPSEIQPLLKSFNGVLDRLQVAFDEQQRFIANAAHELKTPLAMIRAELEAGEAANRDQIRAEVDLMSRRVHQLLQLAETADAANLRIQSTRMGPALQGAVGYLSWKAERAEVAIRFEQPSADVVLDADEGAVFVLAKNLLENAIEFSPAGGVVSLKLDLDGFAVDDEGPGVREADRERVFERFWRAPEQERDGAGLGLALCSEIAKGHGWHIACVAAPSGGARFVVSWGRPTGPAAAKAAGPATPVTVRHAPRRAPPGSVFVNAKRPRRTTSSSALPASTPDAARRAGG